MTGVCMYRICSIASLAVLEDVTQCAIQRQHVSGPGLKAQNDLSADTEKGTVQKACPRSSSCIILATDTY